MAPVENLVTQHLDLWTTAIKHRSTAGRGSSSKVELYGIKKLRELILELTVRGLLVSQDPKDERASELLKRIAAEKAKLVKEGKIKKEKPLAPISDDEKYFDVPATWEWCRLQDISEYIQRGKGPTYADSGAVRVVSQKCVQWTGFEILASRFVDDASLSGYKEDRFLKCNDLLWNSTGTGTVGRANVLSDISEKALVADSHVTVIRPLTVSPRYLLSYIWSPGVQTRIEPEHEKSLVSGSTQQVELNTSAVMALPVPIPPLNEQHSIVAKVDELMALCDQLEQQTDASLSAHQTLVATLLNALTSAADHAQFSSNWQRIAKHFDTLFTTEESIDQLKQTVLQLAVMGKLVPQDPNDEPACNWFQRMQLVENKTRRGVPTEVATPDWIEKQVVPGGWAKYSFAELLRASAIHDIKDGNHGANHPVKSDWTREGLPFITAAQVNNYEIDYDGASKISGAPLDKLRVGFAKPGDVIYTHKGSVGRTAINTQDCVLSPQTTYYRVDDSVLLNRYLMYFFQSDFFTKQVDAVKSQTTRDFVSISQQYLFFALIPPMQEQLRIADKIDQLLAICDQLSNRISSAKETAVSLADVLTERALAEA